MPLPINSFFQLTGRVGLPKMRRNYSLLFYEGDAGKADSYTRRKVLRGGVLFSKVPMPLIFIRIVKESHP